MDGQPATTPWLARAVLGAALLGAVVSVPLTVGAGPAAWITVIAAFCYLGAGLLGLVLTGRHPRDRVGWLLLAASAGVSALPVIDALLPGAHGAWLAVLVIAQSIAATALMSLFTLGVLLFPDGHGSGKLGRTLVPIAIIALALLAVGSALMTPTRGPEPQFGESLAGSGDTMMLAGFALVVPITVLAALTVTFRRRTATGRVRRALSLLETVAWINAGTFIVCAAVASLAELPEWFGAVADQTGIVFPIAAWIGIVRFRLIDLRAVLARTLPYLIAAAVVGGIATAVAVIAGSAAGWLGATTGAVVAAMVALMLRDRLQVLSNLIVYGRRTDPATEHAIFLRQALQDSHRLLITARDDERRRIRRDLHDGLGPTLAGIVLGTEAATRHLDDPARAGAELDRLHEESRRAVQEVRRIVYALRPPVLDSLGLDGAIREQADRLGATAVEVSPLPQLADSLEIGVYLTALEAMKNAAVHARPGSFWVRLAAGDRLALEVHDDGPGLPPDYTPGVGIQSMRERAAELGGTVELVHRHPRGTLVRAEWMLPA